MLALSVLPNVLIEASLVARVSAVADLAGNTVISDTPSIGKFEMLIDRSDRFICIE